MTSSLTSGEEKIDLEELINNRNPMMEVIRQIVAEKEGHKIGFTEPKDA